MDNKETAKKSWAVRFFKPTLDWKFGVRLLVLIVAASVLFGFFLRPCVIYGGSMEPTYGSRGFTFYWNDPNAGDKVTYGDIVAIRNRPRELYLKRVVGLPGDTISFIGGKLYRNGQAVDEPSVTLPSDWEQLPVTVGEGQLFCVGDNRSMPIEMHRYGITDMERIAGKPIW